MKFSPSLLLYLRISRLRRQTRAENDRKHYVIEEDNSVFAKRLILHARSHDEVK